MDSLLSSVRFAPSECGLAVRRVLFGPFSPVIYGLDDVAEHFLSFSNSVLDMQRLSREDFSGMETPTSAESNETFFTFPAICVSPAQADQDRKA